MQQHYSPATEENMVFLETTQDFITTGKMESMNYTPVLIVCGTIFVLSIIAIFVAYRLNVDVLQTLGIMGAIGAICFGLMWAGFGALINSGNNAANSASYDIPAFQEWATDTYMVDLNDTQATALLANAVNTENPYIQSNVYVKMFNGSDAIATLYHDETEWRLVITESVAVPSR